MYVGVILDSTYQVIISDWGSNLEGFLVRSVPFSEAAIEDRRYIGIPNRL